MGQYKVPQNVEAEDKIIGALTLKQFIYAVIGVGWGLVSFSLLRGVPIIFLLVGVPPTLIFLLLGLYQRQDQPFEALFLALVSFFVRPRKLVWEKEPIEQVFTVEPPKPKAGEVRRDPGEVRSELEKLAQIMDSRGLTAKQPELQEPAVGPTVNLEDDRIVAPQVPETAGAEPEVAMSDDILDPNNPSAQNLNVLIENSVQHIREEAMTKMQAETKDQKADRGHHHNSDSKAPAAHDSIGGMTPNPIAGILKAAMENEHLTVSQVAAQAAKHLTLAEGQTVNLRHANRTKSK